MIDFNLISIDEESLIKESTIKFWFSIGGNSERVLKFSVFDPFFNIQFIPGEHTRSVHPRVQYWVGFEVDKRAKDEKPGVRSGFKLIVTDEEDQIIFEKTYLRNKKDYSLRDQSNKKIAWIIGDSNVWASFGNDSFRYYDIGSYFPIRCSVTSLSLNRFLNGNYIDFLRSLPIRDSDILIFYLGEIDFRFTIHKASLNKKVGLPELCSSLMEKYYNSILEISKNFQNQILILSPNPPICDGFLDDNHSPSLGKIEDKIFCFKYFDTFWSNQKKIKYLNWSDDYVDGKGLCKTNMLEDKNHHIKDHSPIKKKLEKKILSMSHQIQNISDPDPKELVDYCLNFDLMEKCIFMQVYEEILSLSYWIKGFRPNNILEIGTMGSTFWLFSKLSTGKKVSIDIEPRDSIIHHFMYGEDWRFFQGNSQTEEMFENVKNFCPQFDFIFIDGDHTYDGVKRDFEMYKNLLSPRGVIGFHDIDPDHIFADSYAGQVYKFWQDLQEGTKTNIVCKKSSGSVKLNGIHSQGFGGIGLWRPN